MLFIVNLQRKVTSAIRAEEEAAAQVGQESDGEDENSFESSGM